MIASCRRSLKIEQKIWLQKTWPNSKTHFTEEKYDHKKAGPRETAESLGCNIQKINTVKEVLNQLDQPKETEAKLQYQEEAQRMIANYQYNQVMAESNAYQFASKTEIRFLVETVNAIKPQINNNNNRNRNN